MSAFTLVLQQLPGVHADEFRNLRSYYDFGLSYQEVLKFNGKKKSSLGADSSSGISSQLDDDVDKPSTESPTLSGSVAISSPHDEDVTETSTTMSTVSTSSSKPDSDVDSLSEKKEVVEPSTPKFHALINEIAKEGTKPRVTFKPDRIMYRERDILNLGRNIQPHEWQLTSPLFGAYQTFTISKICSRHGKMLDNNSLKEYAMIPCEHCGFCEPTGLRLGVLDKSS